MRITYSKILVPLSLVALFCLVLYAAFEFSEEARPASEDGLKRMRWALRRLKGGLERP